MLITELLSPSSRFCANKAKQLLKLIYRIIITITITIFTLHPWEWSPSHNPSCSESGNVHIPQNAKHLLFPPTLRMCELSWKSLYIEHLDCWNRQNRLCECVSLGSSDITVLCETLNPLMFFLLIVYQKMFRYVFHAGILYVSATGQPVCLWPPCLRGVGVEGQTC